MFRGESTLNMDNKGRLAVPRRYRAQLGEMCGGALVVTISLLNRCLVVYPFSHWQDIEQELKNLPALDRKAQAIRHLLIGHATECELDGQGRILVSQSLREFANLEKRVKMIGQAGKFELWNEQAWADQRDELLADVGALLAEPSDELRALVL